MGDQFFKSQDCAEVGCPQGQAQHCCSISAQGSPHSPGHSPHFFTCSHLSQQRRPSTHPFPLESSGQPCCASWQFRAEDGEEGIRGKEMAGATRSPCGPPRPLPGQSTSLPSGQPSFLTSSPLLSFSLIPSFFGNLGPWELVPILGGALLWKAACPWLIGKMGPLPLVCSAHSTPA